jgi:hypothetical protein
MYVDWSQCKMRWVGEICACICGCTLTRGGQEIFHLSYSGVQSNWGKEYNGCVHLCCMRNTGLYSSNCWEGVLGLYPERTVRQGYYAWFHERVT